MIFGLGDSAGTPSSTILPVPAMSAVESPAELASDAAVSALVEAMKQAIATRCNSTDTTNPCVAAGLAQFEQVVGAATFSCQNAANSIAMNNCILAALNAANTSGTPTSTPTPGSTADTCKMSILPSLKICDTYILIGGAVIAGLLIVGTMSKGRS
jgi:hypothetical protein